MSIDKSYYDIKNQRLSVEQLSVASRRWEYRAIIGIESFIFASERCRGSREVCRAVSLPLAGP